MNHCWLHIGMHKTGSTSIQRNLGKIIEPESWRILSFGGRYNMTQALFALFDRHRLQNPWIDQETATIGEIEFAKADWRDQLRKVIQNCGDRDVIISAEGLPDLPYEATESLKNFLQPLFQRISVIGYIREPVAYMTSRFQEILKHRAIEFDFSKVKPNYRNKFEKFDYLFGRANVCLKIFDPSNFSKNCVVLDFCEQVGINPPQSKTILRLNESMTQEACGMLYAYRKFGNPFGNDKQAIQGKAVFIKLFLGVDGSKFKISHSALKESLESEKEDIQWMEERLGHTLGDTDSHEIEGVNCEEDLLTISRETCVQYAANFKKRYGTTLSLESIPATGLVDPRLVSDFVRTSLFLGGKIGLRKHRNRKCLLYIPKWFLSVIKNIYAK